MASLTVVRPIIMVGMKIRNFTPLSGDVSLEDLVSEDCFYRRKAAC